jgi:hypothetical protein
VAVLAGWLGVVFAGWLVAVLAGLSVDFDWAHAAKPALASNPSATTTDFTVISVLSTTEAGGRRWVVRNDASGDRKVSKAMAHCNEAPRVAAFSRDGKALHFILRVETGRR